MSLSIELDLLIIAGTNKFSKFIFVLLCLSISYFAGDERQAKFTRGIRPLRENGNQLLCTHVLVCARIRSLIVLMWLPATSRLCSRQGKHCMYDGVGVDMGICCRWSIGVCSIDVFFGCIWRDSSAERLFDMVGSRRSLGRCRSFWTSLLVAKRSKDILEKNWPSWSRFTHTRGSIFFF